MPGIEYQVAKQEKVKEKTSQLRDIYTAFETDTEELTRGCSFCCEAAGSIDITTLEGLAVRAAMEKMPKNRQAWTRLSAEKEMTSLWGPAVMTLSWDLPETIPLWQGTAWLPTVIVFLNTWKGLFSDPNMTDAQVAAQFNARGGDEKLYGGDGNDLLVSGSGWDTLHGGNGDDTIFGGSGNDIIYGETGEGAFGYTDGQTGNDSIAGGLGDDRVYGGAGNDVILGEEGDDELYGDGDTGQ